MTLCMYVSVCVCMLCFRSVFVMIKISVFCLVVFGVFAKKTYVNSLMKHLNVHSERSVMDEKRKWNDIS